MNNHFLLHAHEHYYNITLVADIAVSVPSVSL